MANEQKRGRSRSENPMVHTAVVLPRDLLDRLRADVERGTTRGLSTEIRERLLATYNNKAAQRDPQTTELVEFIDSLTDILARDLGKKWHESGYVFAALKSGLLEFLTQRTPKAGEGERDISSHRGDRPETVGRTHARQLILPQPRTHQPDDDAERD